MDKKLVDAIVRASFLVGELKALDFVVDGDIDDVSRGIVMSRASEVIDEFDQVYIGRLSENRGNYLVENLMEQLGMYRTNFQVRLG